MADLRAKKAGIGAEIEKKLEARYDQEEAEGVPNAIRLWINAIVPDDDPKNPPIPSGSLRDLHHGLKNGVKLCKLINILLESVGKTKVHMQKKADAMFIALTNIESYNKGCIEYGLAKEFTVQSGDVWEGRKGPFLNVINNLHSLGQLANDKGFGTMYTGKTEKTVSYD